LFYSIISHFKKLRREVKCLSFLIFFFLTDLNEEVELLESEIQQILEEAKERLEEVEYGLVEIDDGLGDSAVVHASRSAITDLLRKFKILNEGPLTEGDERDVFERRGVFFRTLQQIQTELQQNEEVRKAIEGRVVSEKEGLVMLVDAVMEMQEISKKRDALITKMKEEQMQATPSG
jgi:hypothetical protein